MTRDRSVHDLTPKSIAFVVNNYPPKVGGVELHVHALARELRMQGHTVTVVTLDNDNPDATEDGVEVLRLASSRSIGGVLAFPKLGARRRITAILRERRIDVISTHTRFFPMSFLGIRAGRALDVPVVHTEHGSDHVRGVSSIVAVASRVVDWTLGRYVLKSAERVLAISSASAAFVRRLAGRDSTVFHNAIDSGFFAQAAAPGVTPNRLVFLGRLVPGKGWERVVEVSEQLLPEFKELSVHFIGDGSERTLLEKRVASSPHRDRYTIHGYLQPEAIRAVLASSVLLNPTELAEGFQTTLLEAIAAGGTVISAPVAAAEYLKQQGASVQTVDTSDAKSWVEASRNALGTPTSPVSSELLRDMDWSERSAEFVEQAMIAAR